MIKKLYLLLFILLFFTTSCNQTDTNEQGMDNTINIKGFFCSYENELIDLRIDLPREHKGSYTLKNLKYDYKLKWLTTNLLFDNVLQMVFKIDTPGTYIYNDFLTKINNDIYSISTKDLTFEILVDKNLSENKIARIIDTQEIIKFEKSILENDNYHALVRNISNETVYISDVVIGNDVFDKISIAYSKNGIDYSYINKDIEIQPNEKCFIRVNFLLNDEHGYFILKPYIVFSQGYNFYTKPLQAKSISL